MVFVCGMLYAAFAVKYMNIVCMIFSCVQGRDDTRRRLKQFFACVDIDQPYCHFSFWGDAAGQLFVVLAHLILSGFVSSF